MGLKVRSVKASDLPALVQMGFKFFDAGNLPGVFSPERFAEFWTDAVSTRAGLVLVLEHEGDVWGTIGGLRFLDPLTGDWIVQEMFWWVDEDHRGRASVALINGFEQLAERSGAQRIIMSAIEGMHDRALARFYNGRGYTPLEHSFVKEV